MADMTGYVPMQRASADTAPRYMLVLFLLSLLSPVLINVGPILLMAHRLVLLIFFIPCAIRLLSGKAGPIIKADWLMFGSAVWAGFSLIYNHGLGQTVEPIGSYIIEFFGAYLLARVTIRSSDDFLFFVKIFAFLILIMLPLGIMEAVGKRAFLLEIIPNSHGIVNYPHRLGLRRAQVFFSHPIHYGVFTALGFGLIWYCIRPSAKRIWAIPMVFISAICSVSSGALIAIVIQAMMVAWQRITQALKSRWKLFSAIMFVMFLIAELGTNRGFFQLLVSYASFNTGSAYNRILIWRFGMENVWANPIFGLGFNDWVRPIWMDASADNFWLLTTMQYGIPAFLLFATAIGSTLRQAILAKLTHPDDKACQAAYVTVVGGIIVAGGTVHYWNVLLSLVLFIFGSAAFLWTGGAKADEFDQTPAPEEQNTRYTGNYSRDNVALQPQRTKPLAAQRPVTSYHREKADVPVVAEVKIKEKTKFTRRSTLHVRGTTPKSKT